MKHGMAIRRLTTFFFVFALIPCLTNADSNTDRGIAWLNGHQNANGSWGALPDLVPRDTARALLAMQTLHSISSALSSGYAWLATQPLDANQLLAEQALALAAGKSDSSAALNKLAAQRSAIGPDFGGFTNHSGDTYDSALALQAFATSEALYSTNISGLLSTVVSRQNVDGGWGIDQGFDSNPVLTSEVLIGLSALRRQLPPVATIAAAQTYVVRLVHADGSIGADVLQTALALRALALSGYVINSFSSATLTYLRGKQAADGSWSEDPYLTARVLEAFAVDKPNLVIRAGDFTLNPSTVADGTSVTATVIVRNTGTVGPSFSTLSIYASDARATPIASQVVNSVPVGGSETHTITFTPTALQGTHTLVAVADAKNEIDEVREDDNEATASLTVTGKPDLQVFPADITTVPTHLQPIQPGQLTITIHNNGGGDVAAAGYAVYDAYGSAPEVLLQKGTTGPIAAALTQTVQIPVSLAGGAHLIRVVADPDNLISESNETNNQATRTISVTNLSNVDLRIRPGSVIATPARPNTGDSVLVSAIVENAGTDPVQSTVAFYDGVPGAGGVPISSSSVSIDRQSSAQVQTTFTTTASSRVVYAVADPDNLVPEIDETNNSGFVTLTDQYVDLVITREGIVLPKTLPAVGQTLNARVVVRNTGLVAATAAEVVIYDDLPQLGGRVIVDKSVDVPAQGSTVVLASWTVRAGQRFTTAVVNPSHAIFEPNYANDRATKFYTVNGTDTDLSLYSSPPNMTSVVVDPLTLNVSGFVQMDIQGPSNSGPYLVTIFEDVDGDLAYNPEVDNPLGSLLVQPVQQQTIKIPIQGTVRFAPGHLMAYLDSGNALAESREDNNLIDLYHGSCQHDIGRSGKPSITKWTANPSVTLSPVARVIDTNGDGVLDENDVPAVVIAYNGGIMLKRGDTGQTLWSVQLSTSGRQISAVIADLDGDGKAEIIAHLDVDPVTGEHNQHRLVALNVADGSRKWVSPPLDRDPQWDFYINTVGATYSYAGAPAVADLDGDGHPEVICGRTVLNGADGTIKWVGTGGSGRAWKQPDPADPSTNLFTQFFPDQEAPIAVDLNNDGKLEVVAGNTAYRADGTILWQRSDLPDGYTAPLWLGSDVNPKICLVAQGRVWMLNNDGTTLWGPVSIPNGALLGGAPTVFPSFGTVAVAVAGDGYLSAFNAANGALFWTRQVATDVTSFGGTTTNSATAFNQDGAINLFYASRDQFLIIRSDNILQYTLPISNNPYYPMSPVVADVDNDGHAEVIVPGTASVRVMGDGGWYGAPAVFNEASYHAVNISETGVVPTREVQDAFSRVSYRANRQLASSTIVLDPNLALSYPRIDGSGYPASAALTVRVGNSGWGAAPPASVAFYRLNGDNTSTLLSTLQTGALPPGAYQDLSYTYPNPPTAFTFYAVADPNNAIQECDKSDNRSPNFALRLSADIAVGPLGLLVDDPNPRQGDSSTFTATAAVTGAVDTSKLNAQFFLGNPAGGGTAISPLLPVTLATDHGNVSATVTFSWTVNAPPAMQSVFVFFDPTNAIPETDETNNTASTSVNVSTPDPIRKLSGTVALTPPSAEAGTPVRADIVVQNIGNVPLTNVTINYSVTGGTSGSTSLSSLGKNKIALLTLGTFTPSANGTYTVTASAADPVTLIASPKSIVIGPFAGAALTVVPTRVPTSTPIVQAHTRISRTNTINIADDPLFPLIRSHLQQGIGFQANVLMSPDQNLCFKCHVHAQGLIGLEASRAVSGVTVNETASRTVFDRIIQQRGADGRLYLPGYGTDTMSMLAGWALSYWHDATEALRYLVPLVEETLRKQLPDGSWNCNGGCFPESFDKLESWTMSSVDQLSTAYKLTGDPRYLAAFVRGTRWLLAYNYSAVPPNESEKIARVAIALGRAMPYLPPDLAGEAKKRIDSIAIQLRSNQNADGSVGVDLMNPPVIRTAQTLYALSISGAPPSDPAIRSATVWLLNQQKPNGQWGNGFASSMDQTTWAMIALPAAWAKVGQFDVDLHVSVPTSTDLVSSSPTPASSTPINGGRELVWHLPGVTDGGTDAFFNLRLNGLQDQESRGVATAASIAYNDPYSGQLVTRPISVPSITGVAPVGLAVTTDRASYSANSTVSIQETITDASAGITNDVIVRDGSGSTIATLVSAEAVSGLPTAAFPGWHYATAAVLAVPSGASRNAIVPIDFAQQLTQLGVIGTFDPTTIRVSADATPSDEMPFMWFATSGAAGKLAVQIRDDVAAGTALPIHIYFDTLENGLKPASLFDRNATGVGAGLLATYTRVDQPSSNFQASDPSQLTTIPPPFLTNAIVKPQIAASADLDAVRFWEGVFTGAIYAPASGTYQFLLGSARGGWLDVDGVRLLNNGGLHEMREVTGSLALTAGFHRVKVTIYRWDYGTYGMYLKWAPPGSGFDLIPSQNMFLDVPFDATAGTPALLPRGQAARGYTWNTTSTAAGNYSAVATLRQNGAFIVSASAPFTIAPSAQLTASVATDKTQYDVGETVHLTSSAQYVAGNTPLANLSAAVSVADPSATTVSSRPFTVASLAPGQNVPFSFDWTVGTAAAGAYTASLLVKDSGGATLVQKSVPFQVRPTSVSGRGIVGTLSAPATVEQGRSLDFAVSITNGGNSAIADAPFVVQIIDPATQQLADSISFRASAATAATYSTRLAYLTNRLARQKYQAALVSLITGAAVPLANAGFEVVAPTTVVSASVTTDKASYDPGDTLRSTTTVNYVSGAVPLANVAVTTTIGTASGTSTISSITPGTSATTTFDWPVGTTAPGSYTINVVVKDANGNPLAQQTASFTIASTAQTGKGISGTISTSASVVQGSALPITVTITNNGNAALTDAPFAVKIAGDTVPFTASVAMGATTTRQLSYATTPLTPQNYTATLVSLITGQAVTLATTSFTVVPPTVVTAAVTTNKPTYDPGDTLHSTTTVNYVSGAAPLANVTVTTTIGTASGTSTISSITPGTSATTTFDWPVGTTAPGSYTVNVVVKDASGNPLAQQTASFTIASTAQTGKGIAGTITTSASVVQGSALPITVTITNSGNAALTDAPFAVKIAGDTVPFTASVAMGATTTKQISYATTPLTPQNYTATLVSLITGQAVTLATTSFTVVPPTVVTAAVTTNKPTYDPGDTLRSTTTVNYVSGAAPLANVTVTTTIGTASGTSTISSIAPGTSATTTFDWPVGTTAPGSYTVNVVVKDASGNPLAQQTASFTIASTAQTGKGISGTISTSASVVQGSALPITVTITNNGNAALTDAPFAVKIAGDTVPFTASVAMSATTTKQLSYATSALAPGSYTATLVSMITGEAVALSTASFDVKPAITLAFGQSSSARALIWSDCSSGNSATPCTPAAPPFLTQSLTAAGIDWLLSGDQATFFTQLRTGAFSEVILVPPPTPELTSSAELSETVHAGEGLLFIHDHPDAEPKLAAALGVTFAGKLSATSTLLDILATPFTSAGQMSVNGDGVKINLTTAQPVARISATQAPAISLNTFAAGRVVVLPFSTEGTTTADMARFLVSAAGYVSRAATTDARQVVPLDIAVGAPTGGSQNVTVALTIPAGLSMVYALPQPTSGTTWNLTVPGGTTQHVTIWIRLPEIIGTYQATASVAMQGQLPLLTKSVTLRVDADRAAMEAALASDLAALQTNASGSDLAAVSDAQNELALARAATDAASAISHILKIVNDLASISIDTSAARKDADRLLLYWQSRS
ncbi:MAG TPA: CARDB domain-containing protein [Thermoanaerobaculia bacterium]|nr:CARDB domain-containing protein [Thermoanaerobaculia bacterium]